MLVWHLGFQLTPVHERENMELVLSRMKQFHTTNILKRSALCRCLRVVPSGIALFRNVVEKLK